MTKLFQWAAAPRWSAIEVAGVAVGFGIVEPIDNRIVGAIVFVGICLVAGLISEVIRKAKTFGGEGAE